MSRILHKLLLRAPAKGRAEPVDPLEKRCECAVSLIDSRTGETPLVNGRPLMVITRDPAKAMADLMRGRDRKIWDIRVQALHPGVS